METFVNAKLGRNRPSRNYIKTFKVVLCLLPGYSQFPLELTALPYSVILVEYSLDCGERNSCSHFDSSYSNLDRNNLNLDLK